MEIDIAKQRIILLNNRISPQDAQETAWGKKTAAFDALSKVASFLSRPKDEDFELVYHEYRFQPFWHVIAKARYVYDRSANYQIVTGGKEVKSVSLHEIVYEVTNGHIHVPVCEHCIQEEQDEVFIDGVSGNNQSELAKFITMPSVAVKDRLEALVPKHAILVPPQARVSAIMRGALSKMIKGIQADTIIEEHIEVPCVDLYYRPVYAFQYRWKSKNKEAIIEVNGLTGDVTSGKRTFREYLGKVLDQNFLFDIGADAAGMFIPGGSIAVKAVKRYVDSKKK